MAKQAVQISGKKRTLHLFQKLKMCKKCNRYSVLKDETCPKCGSTYTYAEQLARSLFRTKLLNEAAMILILVSLGIIFSTTLDSLYYCLIAGVLFCIGYVVMTAMFLKSEYYLQLEKLLESDSLRIQRGIMFDSEQARIDIRENRVADAYDKLTEISDFIKNDQIRIRRIMALNDIELRKDMELELDSLVPSAYDKDFMNYALEAIRLDRSLVTRNVIGYFIDYRYEIERDFGLDALINVAGSAVRAKLYIQEFAGFLLEFLEYLPKDRLLRLCRILEADPEENWGPLKLRARQTAERRFGFDPEFRELYRTAVPVQ
ncbi:hypothetical protein A8F94_09680 [Bacillus sp. FJAT-27225]|uniref:hypothetical protein n=1 Tax=Bacillus sp. FJAT-27225 TaxID=1743144 RepID=UPI00080C345A|nr:hypothetical protein [Bacillus sp. FJAT-27225]OCA88079.1 hypothetical protein A8F94_09680 [Bacillus sp. FJAT-27225]